MNGHGLHCGIGMLIPVVRADANNAKATIASKKSFFMGAVSFPLLAYVSKLSTILAVTLP
jgi:hypothetical protein